MNFTNANFLESVPCRKENFPMLHSVCLSTPFYIADSISYLHGLITPKPKQNKSLMRIKNQISKKIQAITYGLLTWSLMGLIA